MLHFCFPSASRQCLETHELALGQRHVNVGHPQPGEETSSKMNYDLRCAVRRHREQWTMSLRGLIVLTLPISQTLPRLGGDGQLPLR